MVNGLTTVQWTTVVTGPAAGNYEATGYASQPSPDKSVLVYGAQNGPAVEIAADTPLVNGTLTVIYIQKDVLVTASHATITVVVGLSQGKQTGPTSTSFGAAEINAPAPTCQSNLDGRWGSATWTDAGVITYRVNIPEAACAPITVLGDSYTLPAGYTGPTGGLTKGATPQKYIPSGRVTLTIPKGQTEATETVSIASVLKCGVNWVQSDVYAGPRQDTVYASGSNGYIARQIEKITYDGPQCQTTPPTVKTGTVTLGHIPACTNGSTENVGTYTLTGEELTNPLVNGGKPLTGTGTFVVTQAMRDAVNSAGDLVFDVTSESGYSYPTTTVAFPVVSWWTTMGSMACGATPPNNRGTTPPSHGTTPNNGGSSTHIGTTGYVPSGTALRVNAATGVPAHPALTAGSWALMVLGILAALAVALLLYVRLRKVAVISDDK